MTWTLLPRVHGYLLCNEWLFEPSLAKFHKECYKRLHSFVLTSLQLRKQTHGDPFLEGFFGQGIPNDPSTDEDVRKAPLVFLCFMVQSKVVTGRS
jgi:hypothetical protein